METKKIITLKNLAEATEQEVFDQVVNHLRAQGRASFLKKDSTMCAYRSFDGLKCAAGCLISDDEYTPDMDSYDAPLVWQKLVEKKKAPEAHNALIQKLQNIHDFKKVDNWEYFLEELAKDQKLTYTPPSNHSRLSICNVDPKNL